MTFPLIVADGTWVDGNGNSYTGIGSWFQWTSPSVAPTFTWSFDLDDNNNLTIGRYDATGALTDSPIGINAATGVITMPGLPTTDPGIAGALWNNANVLNVSSAGVVPTPGVPVNTIAPVVSGTGTVGSTLSCDTGTWTSSSTPTYSYQWLRNGSPIQGAISATHVVVTADNGTSVSCTVTATNTAGSATATSNAVSISTHAPVLSAAPVVSGNGIVGATLTTTNGTWTNSPNSYQYNWNGYGSPVNGPTYVTVSNDVGSGVSCTVTAINSSGSSSARSNAISIAPATGAPVNISAPYASGDIDVGTMLSSTTGHWTNSPTHYQYFWNGAGSPVNNSTYRVVSGDVGNSVSCIVTAFNSSGSSSATSNPVS